MKNKKGFTLVELLAVIVIIISITGIAIVSFMKISEKQKENEYEKVKEQIFSAAEQYFISNEYLFDGIEESGYGIITVGKLVENDYLNKVTNPITGKPINNCDQIKVQRDKKGKFKLSFYKTFEHDNSKCDSNVLILKSNENAPDLKLSFNVNHIIEDSWFNNEELKNKNLGDANNGLFVKIETNAKHIDYCTGVLGDFCETVANENKIDTSGDGPYYDKVTYNKEMTESTTCYIAVSAGGETTRCIRAGVDITKPTVTLDTYASKDLENVRNKTASSYNGAWYSGYVGVKATYSDNISVPTIKYQRQKGSIGGSYEKNIERSGNELSDNDIYDWSEADGESIYKYESCDKAGNCSDEQSKIVKLDKVAPDCNAALLSKNAASTGWYNKSTGSPTLTLSATDGISGIKGSSSNSPTITEGDKTYSYTFADNAGNPVVCSKNVKYDNTAPVVAVNISHNESTWYNTDLSYTVSASDDISDIGSLKGYWNAREIPTSNVNDAVYKWDTDHYKSGGSGTADLTKLANGVYSDGDNTKFSAQGHRKLRYIACDKAGNCTTSSEKQFKIDKSAPSCNTASLSKNAASTGWYNISTGAPTLTLSATDTFSGIKGSSSNNPTITAGDKTYSYTFVDNVNNSVTCSKNIKYDNTAPVITNVQKPTESYNYCGGVKAIYTSFNVTDTFSSVDRIDHFMDSHTDNNWYKNYTYDSIATKLPSSFTKYDIGSLISVYNGKITKNNDVFDYYYFSTSDNTLGTRTITNGYNVNRAWSYDTLATARTKGCGTITNSSKTPGTLSAYCNYVAAKDTAGNKAARKICYDGTDVGKNE